jgi:diacylglycerol kinase family enzyme
MPVGRGGLPDSPNVGPEGLDSVVPESGIGLANAYTPNLTKHLSRVLVILNPLAGWKGASDAFAKHVSETLDKSGVVHKTRQCPPENLQRILSEELKARPGYDGVLLAGGDGTVNAYVSAMFEKENEPWRHKPIAILPAGLNNGFAASLGITNAGVTTASLISARTRPVPIFVATVDGKRLAAFLGAMHIGMFSDIICTSKRIKNHFMGYVALPPPQKTNFIATMYHLFGRNLGEQGWRDKNISGAFRWRDPATKAIQADGAGFALLSVSQTVYHHYRYSLTPHGFLGQPFVGPFRGELKPRLAVTAVAPGASRSRLMHLLLKEASTGEVEDEDGVRMFDAEAIELCMDRVAGSEGKTRKILLDGEEVDLEPGQSFKISPTNMALWFRIP